MLGLTIFGLEQPKITKMSIADVGKLPSTSPEIVFWSKRIC